MKGLAISSRDSFYLKGPGWLNADLTTAYKNFTPPGGILVERFMKLARKVNSGDIKTQSLDLMPGFRFSWWYSGAKVTPENRDKQTTNNNKHFVRLTKK